MDELKNKAVNGVKWTSLYSILTVILNPISLTILARLLTPEEFGKIAIVTIIMGFSKQIARMGFSKAIIQKDEISDGDLSSIFWFEQFLGGVGFIIIYFLAEYLVIFFDAPDAVNLIKVSALVFVIEPIDLVFRSLLKKELRMKLLNLSKSVRLLVVQVTKVIFAFLGFGAMSVVIGNIVGIFMLTFILFYVFYKEELWLPKFYFSFEKVKPYLKFGIFISGKSVFNNLFNYIDEIIIGGTLGSETLGIYHFSKNILKYITKLINKPISEVGYPLLSKLTSDLKIFNRIYTKIIKFIGSVSIPAHFGIVITSPLFVPLFFGEKWLDAIPLIIILSMWGMFKSLYSKVISSALYSLGKSDWIFYATVIDLPIRLLLFYLVAPYGVNYIGIALCLMTFTKFIIYQFVLGWISDVKVLNIIQELKYILISSITMLLVLYIFNYFVVLNQSLKLVSLISIGVLIYIGEMYMFEKNFIFTTINMIKNS